MSVQLDILNQTIELQISENSVQVVDIQIVNDQIVDVAIWNGISVFEDSELVGDTRAIDFISGTNVSISAQKVNNKILVTINSTGGGGSGTVESVTGDGVDNTDPDNPVLSFPTPAEIGAQETLVSGANIKTINGSSVLGSGNLSVSSRTIAYKNTAPVSFTGAAVASIIRSVLIPANTIQAGDMVYFETIFRKGNTTGTYTSGFIYANTSVSLAGVTSVAQLTTMGTTDKWLKHIRTMVVEASNSSYVLASGTGVASDIVLTSQATTNLTIDWSIDQYLILAYTPSNALDTITNQLFLVEIVR